MHSHPIDLLHVSWVESMHYPLVMYLNSPTRKYSHLRHKVPAVESLIFSWISAGMMRALWSSPNLSPCKH